MQRKIKILTLSMGLSFVALEQSAALVFAQTGHEGHAAMSHEGMGHGNPGAGSVPATSQGVPQGIPQGVVIRESKVQDTTFVYRLYTWEERNVMMKGMESHEMPGMDKTGKSTHHLMVFVKGTDGKYLSGGKVGFIVTGPDKAEFKTLSMGMYDGYGADVPLKGPGGHTIKTKAVFGDRTLTEEFIHNLK